ncbi:MAG: magnesium chelatase subunit D family protein [Firmicutes bacterium]|nr:magnesium chelatase subunit D family protein [Bacillota bacterium]
MDKRYVFPYPAVIGQDKVKKALLLNVVNPLIGGVLISGEKGTAKSTLVRGVAALMLDMEVVELPLNVTEDRLVGSIDLERAIKDGKKSFEPGILKKAHGNMLYVDEVNLLSEHIVNCLLEVSASGVNVVEREGISCSHPSCFVLVGTMNPEEGKLRPQFLDRFGLFTEVSGTKDLHERMEIIKRRLEYEKDPEEYLKLWEQESCRIRNNILKARDAVGKCRVSEDALKLAAEISEEANCAGHRAELVMVETAKAIAALSGRLYVTLQDIKEAAQFALPHRLRDAPQLENTASKEQTEDRENNDNQDMVNEQNEERHECENEEQQREQEHSALQESRVQDDGDDDRGPDEKGACEDTDNIEEPGEIFQVKPFLAEMKDLKVRKGSGKRSRVKTDSLQGRYVKYAFPKGKAADIAFDATFRAAAPFQNARERNGLAIAIHSCDLREKVRERRTGCTLLFIVDASGSMGANRRMKAVKGAILSLLDDAYQKRDRVGLVAFRKDSAELLLGITRSVDLAHKKLKEIPTGGRTPMTAGLQMGYEIIKAVKVKDPDMIPILILISDGRSNVSLNGENPLEASIKAASRIAAEGIKTLVIDTECDFICLGLAKRIAEAMKADYYKLEELEANRIISAVKKMAEQ